jgi:hypothetical protein
MPILPQPRSFDKPSNIWRKVWTVLLLIMYEQCCSSLRNFLSNSRCSFSPSGVNIFVGILLSNSLYSFLSLGDRNIESVWTINNYCSAVPPLKQCCDSKKISFK